MMRRWMLPACWLSLAAQQDPPVYRNPMRMMSLVPPRLVLLRWPGAAGIADVHAPRLAWRGTSCWSGVLFAVYSNVRPRGRDKLFAPNW
jgi:hypothetical protein